MKEKKCRNFHLNISGNDLIAKFKYFNDCNVIKCYINYENYTYVGIAKKSPEDEMNKDFGEQLALQRAIDKIIIFLGRINREFAKEINNQKREIQERCSSKLNKYQQKIKEMKNDEVFPRYK